MSTLDPELLMRYADNELNLPERRLVEEKLRTDPEAEAIVTAFRNQRSLLPAAFEMVNDESGLHACETVIDRALDKRRRQQRQADIRRWALPIAASLLMMLLGGALSFQYADQRARTEAARLLAEHAKDRELALETRIGALERMLSGNTLTWTNDASGTMGSITPLRTFQTPAGQWCREYRETTHFPNTTEETLSIACRNDHQSWTMPPEPGAT
ncbi:MAG: hypothetical protein AAGA21_19305 [Pseudomonadota bacterium]